NQTCGLPRRCRGPPRKLVTTSPPARLGAPARICLAYTPIRLFIAAKHGYAAGHRWWSEACPGPESRPPTFHVAAKCGCTLTSAAPPKEPDQTSEPAPVFLPNQGQLVAHAAAEK